MKFLDRKRMIHPNRISMHIADAADIVNEKVISKITRRFRPHKNDTNAEYEDWFDDDPGDNDVIWADEECEASDDNHCDTTKPAEDHPISGLDYYAHINTPSITPEEPNIVNDDTGTDETVVQTTEIPAGAIPIKYYNCSCGMAWSFIQGEKICPFCNTPTIHQHILQPSIMASSSGDLPNTPNG